MPTHGGLLALDPPEDDPSGMLNIGTDDLRTILRNVTTLRSQGRTDREIDSLLRRSKKIPVNSLNVLEQQAQAKGLLGPGGFGDPVRRDGADSPDVSTAGAAGRSLLRGVSGGFSDELGGLVAGAGAALVPGGQGFSEARESFTRHARRLERADKRQVGGLAATGLEVGGSLLPGSIIFRGIRRGTQLGRTASGAAAGAAEGGILGFGEAEGSARERLPEAGIATAAGGLLGAFGGKIGSTAAGRRASQMKPKAGARLGDKARDLSGLTGRSSKVRASVREGKQAARNIFSELEDQGRDISERVTEVVLEDRTLREAAERVAPDVVAKADEAGGQAIPKRLSFDEFDTIQRDIRNRASAFKKAAGSDLPANVSPVNVKKAEAALEKLDDVMKKELDGFPEARRMWAKQKARSRALIDGRKTFKSRAADDFVSAFERIDDPDARKAFREGGATELTAWVESLTEPKSVLRRIQNDPQLREKLRIILGGEDKLDDFTAATRREELLREQAHDFEATKRFVKRYLGWILLGAGAGGAGGAGLLETF